MQKWSESEASQQETSATNQAEALAELNKAATQETNILAEPLFTESEYEDAWANASYWARQRFVKKTTKVKYRRAHWTDGKAEAKAAGLPESAAQPGVRRMRLPPSDLHRYIKGFIETNRPKTKEEK